MMGGMMPGGMAAAASANADDINNMDLEGAQAKFLNQAKMARSTPNQQWGPGGVGGMGSIKNRTTEEFISVPRRNGHVDPYSLDSYGDDRILTIAPSKAAPNHKPTLMSAAIIAGTKLAGTGAVGPGYSASEIARLDGMYNEEDAMQKYIFASDKVRGGYMATSRKTKFNARKREIQSKRDDAYDEMDFMDMGMGDDMELGGGGGGGYEILPGDTPIPATSSPHRQPKQINNAPPLDHDDDDDDDDAGGNAELRRHQEKSKPKHEHSDSDSDQETYVDIEIPDARNPGQTRTVRDKMARYKRREERKAKARGRVHKIMEMDPNSMKELRESIRAKREAAKAAREAQGQQNEAVEQSVLGLDGGDEQGARMPPAPPSPQRGLSSVSGTEHLIKLMKSQKDLVSAVEETITTDPFNPANTTSKELNLPPPPTHIEYDGTETNNDAAHDFDDGAPEEWRSTTRSTDIRQAAEDSTKVLHAATLVDVLDTISELRENVEKVKKEKRQILTNLKRLDKQEPGNKEAVAVRARLLQAKGALDEQIKEMDGMLTKLCDSRKQLMDRPKHGAAAKKKSAADAPESDTDTDGESGGMGGLDGLRERRKKRREKGQQAKENKPTLQDIKQGELAKVAKSEDRDNLEEMWRGSETASLKSGASSEIQTGDDGCPMYHKLLLDIEYPVNVTSQQKETYDFFKQASTVEQMEFLNFALNPAMAKDLLPTSSAFLKLHAHSFKSIRRFQRTVAFQNPHLLELLCCCAEEYHVDYLSPVLALLWLFAKIPSNRSILLRRGVLGTSIGRLKRYSDLVKRKGLEKRKGIGVRAGKGSSRVNEQTLCALTLLAGLCFE
jgi:hypothetical protein